jgi:hypothetical protein
VKSAYKIAVARREALAGRDASTSDRTDFSGIRYGDLKFLIKFRCFYGGLLI